LFLKRFVKGVKEVKRKVLVILVALMAVAMLATPLVGTAQAYVCRSRRSTSYIAVVKPNLMGAIPFPGYPRYRPSVDNQKIVFNKCTEVMDGYKVNIGGELVPSAIPDVYQIVGGTTYVLGTDFTYEGTWWSVTYFDRDYWYWSVKYTITFLTASGIDGALEMYARLWGQGLTGEGTMHGHGRGDLGGVVVKATLNGVVLDADYGVAITHVGTACGWPT
jgi:hypothetical protein